MRNPWLDIPLADYEGHMALPEVGQSSLLADIFEEALREHRPASVAVIGCAGGNGFDRIDAALTRRVVGIDINAAYLAEARARWGARLPGLELVEANILERGLPVPPVELIYAALVFEYVDPGEGLAGCRALLERHGRLVTVLQMADAGHEAVTPSPFASIQTLAGRMRLHSPVDFAKHAAAAGLIEARCRVARSSIGKEFAVQVFRHAGTGEVTP